MSTLPAPAPTPAPAEAVAVARLSPGFLAFGWASAVALNGFVDLEAATRGWSDLANLHQAALAVGAMFGLWVVVSSMGLVVEGHQLTMRGFWFVWRGNPWAVRGALNRSGLTLEVRQQSADGPEDVRVDVAAVQGSVIEQLRGNVRAAGAIRRLRNVQAATPLDDDAPALLRRRLRFELALWVVGAAAAQWLLSGLLWSLG